MNIAVSNRDELGDSFAFKYFNFAKKFKSRYEIDFTLLQMNLNWLTGNSQHPQTLSLRLLLRKLKEFLR